MAASCSLLANRQSERKKNENGGDRNGTNTKYKIQVTMLSNIKVRAENKHLRLKVKLQHCAYDMERNGLVYSLPYTVYCTVYRVTSMYGQAELVGSIE